MTTQDTALIQVTVDGAPVCDGHLLTPDSAEFRELDSLEKASALARRLRGQFAVIVRRPDRIFGIADFCGSLPVYYSGSAPGWKAATKLQELRQGGGRLAKEALFFLAVRGSVGIVPTLDGVRQLWPGHVLELDASGSRQQPYLDWCEMSAERETSLPQARDEFVEIATSYLRGALAGEPAVGCLLSGGTDSVLAAWLLKQVHPRVICFTADYGFQKWSEYDAAQRHAEVLGLELVRVVVGNRQHWSGLADMNTAAADQPASHNQLTSLLALGRAARQRGVRKLVSGDNADTLFMGLEGFFRGLPPDLPGYEQAGRAMTPRQKLERIVNWHWPHAAGLDLLTAMGARREECDSWVRKMRESDHEVFGPLAERLPLWSFHQACGQMWAGMPYQSCWLPAERTAGVTFLSPYLDAAVVRFGVGLPVGLKYRDGLKKYLLVDLLEKGTGIRVEKRSSPNPSRLWSLLPPPLLAGRLDGRVRRLYLKAWLGNYARKGGEHGLVNRCAAMGLWLRAQGLSNPTAG